MINYIKYILLLTVFAFVWSCSDNDDPALTPQPTQIVAPNISIKLNSSSSVKSYNVVKIEPEVTITNGDNIATNYQWAINENGRDSIISDQKILQFISPKAGEYIIDFVVTCGKTTKKASTKVIVEKNEQHNYYGRANKIVDYRPAPNASLLWSLFADNKEDLIVQAQDMLDFESDIPLGLFGGSITLKFDHTVINYYNKPDFYVQMYEATDWYTTPVIVMVAYDANKNGIPDESEWYEIAGSEHHKSTTIKGYEITYYKPDPDKEPVPGKDEWQYDIEYLKWTSNKGEMGYITKTETWSIDNFYPTWEQDSYTLKGTKLYLPTKDISDGKGLAWNVGTYEWGYGGIKNPDIDISWAVDKDGNKVYLPGIDFVKIYVPTLVQIGEHAALWADFQFVEDINLIAAEDS